MNKIASETLHGHVSDYIRSMVYAKEWGPGRRIPSEHALMEEFSVSRGTVRKAIKTLVDEGMLEQEHGRGTFVCDTHLSHPGGDRPLSFAASLGAQGVEFQTKILTKERIPATHEVAYRLRIAEGDPVLRLRRLRVSDGKPIMVLDAWCPLDVCPGIDLVDLEETSMFDAVENCSGARIAHSRMVYSARAAGKDLAAVMGVIEGTPILNLEQLIELEDGRPVEWSDTMLCAGQSIVGEAHQSEPAAR